MSLALPLIVGLTGLFLHFSFVATHAAFMPLTTIPSGEQTDGGDQQTNPWQGNPNRLLAFKLVGTSITIVFSVTAGVQISELFNIHPVVAIIGMGLLTVFTAEAIPQSLGVHHGLELGNGFVLPARLFDFLLTPIIGPVSKLTASLFQDTNTATDQVSREEIVKLLDSNQTANLDPEDRQMIQRILELPETEISDCMTPLVEVVAISDTASISDAVAVMISEGHSRIPVYKNRIDNIVGLVTHRDVLFLNDSIQHITAVMRQVKFVPESKRVDEMLHEMRQDQGHFCVVVDEYGGTVGIITLEDLIEEIVGEIRDERDTEEPSIRMLSAREWRIPARTELEDVYDVVGIELPEGNYETVAGYILALTGRIPEAGEVIKMEGYIFRIEQSTDRAIHMVHLTLPREYKS